MSQVIQSLLFWLLLLNFALDYGQTKIWEHITDIEIQVLGQHQDLIEGIIDRVTGNVSTESDFDSSKGIDI